ncbi:MAG TPA: response regulator [Usitatibacter sp.]|nr:response regulator [Usitatibacter sp.]
MKPIVLLVEDNERNRKLVRTILEFRGYEVVECEDGEPSLDLARKHRPAVVLMDIELPKMDGITALKRLQADPETSAIPVIAVTASVTPSERERVAAAGFSAYIAKPIDVATFGEQVDRIAGRAGAAA